MSRERYHRARIAGAGVLNREAWGALVAKAEAIETARRPSFTAAASCEIRPWERGRSEPVWLAPGAMVVSARDVLNVEAALALAETIEHEIRDLAAEDLCTSRRQRLLRMIDEVRERIVKRGAPS